MADSSVQQRKPAFVDSAQPAQRRRRCSQPNTARWALSFAALWSCAFFACTNGRPSAIPLGDGPQATAELAKRNVESARREKKRRAERLHALAEEEDGSQSWGMAWDEVEPEGSDADTKDSTDSDSDTKSVAASKTDGKDSTADKSDSANASAELVIAGDYQGEDTSLYRFDGAPDRHEEDKAARTRVTKNDEKRITITPLDSSNGKEICSLEAELKGDSAKIKRNQHCFDQDSGEVNLSGTVTSGSASFAKGRLVLDLELDLSMDLGEEEISGSLKYHFEGDKQDGKKKGR